MRCIETGQEGALDPWSATPVSACGNPELGVCKARFGEGLDRQGEAPAMGDNMSDICAEPPESVGKRVKK